ncbi:MAG TPA: hypothetical protein VMU92_13535 [Acidobacteriaceae bacterium]|nr:hypothetical protein [Acidobacteriaceae bacterium]
MTPLEALLELLGRVGANNGAAVLVNEEELDYWPVTASRAMKSHKLLVKASPATSVVCPGCEQECVMPVHIRTHETRGPASFIVCDKRDDINRVAVPAERLRQWRCNAHAIADLIAGLLGSRRPDSGDTSAVRWEVGMFKGRKHSSHIVLLTEGRLTLCVAGHSIALADVLTLGDNSFRLDKQTLIRLVDKPVAGAGDVESAAQRRERLKKRVQAEKAKGNKAFLKAVSEDEGISVSRLKQLLQEKPTPRKR